MGQQKLRGRSQGQAGGSLIVTGQTLEEQSKIQTELALLGRLIRSDKRDILPRPNEVDQTVTCPGEVIGLVIDQAKSGLGEIPAFPKRLQAAGCIRTDALMHVV